MIHVVYLLGFLPEWQPEIILIPSGIPPPTCVLHSVQSFSKLLQYLSRLAAKSAMPYDIVIQYKNAWYRPRKAMLETGSAALVEATTKGVLDRHQKGERKDFERHD